MKVHPEEVEAVINTHPWVRMSLVKARRNAITGAIVTADVVLAEEAPGQGPRPGGGRSSPGNSPSTASSRSHPSRSRP